MNLKVILYAFAVALLVSCSNSSKKPAEQASQNAADPVEVVYHVEGMTCDHCEQSIEKGVTALPGISLVEANHEDSTTKVLYDPSKIDEKAIAAAIEKRGYTVVAH